MDLITQIKCHLESLTPCPQYKHPTCVIASPGLGQEIKHILVPHHRPAAYVHCDSNMENTASCLLDITLELLINSNFFC